MCCRIHFGAVWNPSDLGGSRERVTSAEREGLLTRVSVAVDVFVVLLPPGKIPLPPGVMVPFTRPGGSTSTRQSPWEVE